MKRLILILVVTACGDKQETSQEPSPRLVKEPYAPPKTIPAMELPSQYNFYQDRLNTTVTHEFGHALGLIHPFDSIDYGHDCRRALQERHPDIDFPIRDYMHSKDSPDWDYDDSFPYDKRSIMQYDVCRQGYLFDATPSPQDYVEVNALHATFVGTAHLTLPVLEESLPQFRITSDVPVCVVREGVHDTLLTAIDTAIEMWNKSAFKLHFDGVCQSHHYSDKNTVRIDWRLLDSSIAGSSRVGASLERVTMTIAVDHDHASDYTVDDIEKLYGLGL